MRGIGKAMSGRIPRNTRSTAGEVFLVGMDRKGVVRISRSVDEPTLGRYLREIADELTAGRTGGRKPR
ncbi:hypothetical protein SAMN05216223_12088 [Actinacidiphila yanglinensis]|uniref:Uncharacterized protein n=1 Tax=Actinacidiphila yanglinensis TaxID=310779 RepID=A0A1H6DW85_9ACTN|nr:hypothetical protein SAMN05216223_12088 [Actinacidiphila yanglinensis]